MVYTMNKAMDDYQPVLQEIQESSAQEKIASLIKTKKFTDALHLALVLSTTTATVCNAIWEEPTLQSDYWGANALSVCNRMNAAASVILGVTDIAWLIKPYCDFSSDATERDSWAFPMNLTHCITGHTRGVIAGLVGIGAGIRRYPYTLTVLTANALLNLNGFLNAKNHDTIDTEIHAIQDKELSEKELTTIDSK